MIEKHVKIYIYSFGLRNNPQTSLFCSADCDIKIADGVGFHPMTSEEVVGEEQAT